MYVYLQMYPCIYIQRLKAVSERAEKIVTNSEARISALLGIGAQTVTTYKQKADTDAHKNLQKHVTEPTCIQLYNCTTQEMRFSVRTHRPLA